jgi:hypothetical protein
MINRNTKERYPSNYSREGEVCQEVVAKTPPSIPQSLTGLLVA